MDQVGLQEAGANIADLDDDDGNGLGAPLPLETVNQSLSGKSFIMKIRKRERNIGDSMQYQYVVLDILERKAEDDIGCSSSTTNSKSTEGSHYNYLNST
ncbi:hypothetical protein ACJIZ3_008829 [Penstemon smallii]|uniref:Uncharacterized protein n=1 Tax=Penstemon smallii TaxID=265156 RepID=A0ABD3TD16_9LAMI